MDMRRRFGEFMESEDAHAAANSILVVIDRTCSLLTRQIAATGKEFREVGGFTERLSAARLEKRDALFAAEGAPNCPLCGKPMRKMVAKKGRNAGNAFWSCTGYPDCKGTRSFK